MRISRKCIQDYKIINFLWLNIYTSLLSSLAMVYIIPIRNPLKISLFVPDSELSASPGHMAITPLEVNKYTMSQKNQSEKSNHSMFQLHQLYIILHYW